MRCAGPARVRSGPKLRTRGAAESNAASAHAGHEENAALAAGHEDSAASAARSAARASHEQGTARAGCPTCLTRSTADLVTASPRAMNGQNLFLDVAYRLCHEPAAARLVWWLLQRGAHEALDSGRVRMR